ncbi:MAG: hypothetical protein R6U98_06625 [Pirellulaceae bacterium]
MFFRGDQWNEYTSSDRSRSGSRWRPRGKDPWRVRLTINRLIAQVHSSISTFLRMRPIIIATPSTDEDIDRQSSKVGEMLLRYYWDHLEFDTMLIRLLRSTFIYGSGFVYVDWDPSKGKRISTMEVDEEGNLVENTANEGSPSIEIIDPLSFSVEPSALFIEDCNWCMTTKIARRAAIESTYGVKLSADKEEELESDVQSHIPYLVENQGQYSLKERVAVHTMFERPTDKYPDGRRVVIAGSEEVASDPLPSGEDGPEIRIVHFKDIPLEGEFWPTSRVAQSIPIQMEINRGRSQLIENRNLCARPKLLSPRGALRINQVTARAGEIIKYNPVGAKGFEPKFLTPPSVPAWVMSMISMANDDLMDIGGRHDVSQGSTTSNVTSGKHAAIYKASDDATLAPQIREFEGYLKKIGHYLLSVASENMRSDQTIQIVGKNRATEAFKFHANDVSSKTNVTYEIASQLPWARESVRSQLMWMYQASVIDRETLLERLELPTSQRLYESDQDHRLNARTENEELEQEFFPPFPTDDDRVHIEEHSKHINLPENRKRYIQELKYEIQMAQLVAEQTGQEPEIPMYPSSLQFILKHLEAHRNNLPKQEPPPPAAKLNLSLDRLLQNPAVLQNPQLLEELLPVVLELARDGAGASPSQPQQAQGGEPKPRAPQAEHSPGLGSPPGGADGQMGMEAGVVGQW